MKGIMVPLLIVLMTGSVIGQQSNPSNQFGGNSFPPPPSAPANNGLPATSQSVADSQLAPFELEVTEKAIESIKIDEEGYLRSDIAPRDPSTGKPLPRSVVNGVALVLRGTNSLRGVSFSSAPKTHQFEGKNILAFGLTDSDIRNLRTSRLVYDFAADERGKYDSIIVFYVPPTTPKQPAGPTPDDVFNNVAAQPRNTPSSLPMLPLPEPIAPGNPQFMGPVHPSQINLGGLGSGLAQNSPAPSQWKPSEFRPPTGAGLAGSGNPLTPAPRQNIDPKRLTDTWPGSRPTTNPPTSFEEETERRRQELAQKRQWELDQKNSALFAREQSLRQKEAEMAAQQDELNRRQQYLDSIRSTRPTGLGPDYAAPTGPIVGTDLSTNPFPNRPERWASRDLDSNQMAEANSMPPSRSGSAISPKPTGGIQDYQASLPGQPNAAGEKTNPQQDGRVHSFVLLMLIGSLGLNIYLGWISRGFYVQYNELAEELRETFSGTLSG